MQSGDKILSKYKETCVQQNLNGDLESMNNSRRHAAYRHSHEGMSLKNRERQYREPPSRTEMN